MANRRITLHVEGMPYRIAKSFVVESGHMLSKHPGACRFPHGHSRTIEVILTADTLDDRDMVCDFKAIKQALETAAEHFDHSLAVNTKDPSYEQLRETYGKRIIPFENIDPTTEAMAKVIFETVREALRAGANDPVHPVAPTARLEKVRVSETATSWAEYWE